MAIRRREVLAAAAGLVTPLAGHAQTPADETIRIGILTDMTGPFSTNTGMSSVIAARMAVADFGGTVSGYRVEVISADHQNKPELAISIAKKWFDVDDVRVIADLVNTSVALAVMDVARNRDRLSFVTGSGSTSITNENCTANNIQWTYDSYATANSVVTPLIASGRNDWFFVTADYAFGRSTQADATKIVLAAGGRVVGSALHPPGTTDFASYLLHAQSSGATVIAFANAGADSVNAIKQSAEFGMSAKAALVSLALVINDVNAIGLDAAQGIYLCEGFYWDRTEGSRAFAGRFLKETGKMPNMAHAAMYSAITHYLKAVSRTNGDTRLVMAAMKSSRVDDSVIQGGKIRQNGLMVHDMFLLQVKAPAQSRAPWDDCTIVKTILGDEAFAPISQSRCGIVAKP